MCFSLVCCPIKNPISRYTPTTTGVSDKNSSYVRITRSDNLGTQTDNSEFIDLTWQQAYLAETILIR